MDTKTLDELLAEQLASQNNTTQTSAVDSTSASMPASTITPKSVESNVPTTQLQSASITAPETAYALNLPGVSDSTKQALSDLVSNGYTPSSTVDAALKELNDIIELQPASFSSPYQKQIDDIMNAINNREDFTYDPNSDASYQQYKDLFTQAGRKGMEDTLGRAATLTGGYGNSYANSAAQQTFQDYMTQLTGQVPSLRSQAMNEYNAQGDALNQQYGLANDAYNREYSTYMDGYNRWLAQQQMAQDTYNTERGFDYANYQNQLNTLFSAANQENAQYTQDRQYAYQTATNMLQLGKMPSDDVLEAAGISKSDAKKIYNKYKPKKSSSSSSRSSGGSSGSASTSSKNAATDFGSLYQVAQNAFMKNKMPTAGSVIGAPASAIKGATKGITDWVSSTVKKNTTPKKTKIDKKLNRLK